MIALHENWRSTLPFLFLWIFLDVSRQQFEWRSIFGNYFLLHFLHIHSVYDAFFYTVFEFFGKSLTMSRVFLSTCPVLSFTLETLVTYLSAYTIEHLSALRKCNVNEPTNETFVCLITSSFVRSCDFPTLYDWTINTMCCRARKAPYKSCCLVFVHVGP